MKKILIIILTFLLFVNAFGQNDSTKVKQKKLIIAVNLGANLSIPFSRKYLIFTFSNFDAERTHSSAFGYFGEFQLNYMLSQKFFVNWDLGYTQSNQKYSSSDFSESKLRQYAIHNNLMVNYYIPKFQIYLGIGVYNNYNFRILEEEYFKGDFVTPDMLTNPNGKPQDDPLIPSENTPFINDYTDLFKNNEIGFVGEIGKRFTISKKLKINSFVRYNQSVVNVVPDNMNLIYYNMYVSLGVGLMY